MVGTRVKISKKKISKRRNESMLKKAILLVLILLSIILAGCIEEEPVEVEEKPTETEKPSSELRLKIGETAKTSKLEITVENVFKSKVIGGKYGNYWAEEGKVFVFAKVSVKNINPELKEWYIGYVSFSASDERGRRYDVKYMSIDNWFEGGDLYPGEYREGLIAFEVPENIKTLKIKYDFGGLFKVKLATWEINMSDIPTKEPKVEILGGEIKYKPYLGGYSVENVKVIIKNTGDLPIYIGTIEIKYGDESWEYLTYVGSKIRPGEQKTIEVNEFKYLDSKPASVMIRIVDDDKIIAEGYI